MSNRIPLYVLNNFDEEEILGVGENNINTTYVLDAEERNSFEILAPIPPVGSLNISFTNFKNNQTVNIVMRSSGSAYTINWTGSTFRWSGGLVPTPTSSANRYDLYTFVKINGIIYGGVTLGMF